MLTACYRLGFVLLALTYFIFKITLRGRDDYQFQGVKLWQRKVNQLPQGHRANKGWHVDRSVLMILRMTSIKNLKTWMIFAFLLSEKSIYITHRVP